MTVVLIGAETWNREWVKYEIEESHKRKNGLLGVYINQIDDQYGKADEAGPNPFNYIYVEQDGRKIRLADLYSTYYWFSDKGYENLGSWVENAAKAAGR